MHGHSQLGAVAPFLEPRMIQRLLSTNSLLLVQDKQLPDQILAFVGDLIKLAVSEMVVSLLDLAEDLCSILALEGQVSTYERVQENTEGPYIGLLTVGAFEDLRCHVVRSSRHRGQLAVIARGLGQTEIDQAHCVVSCNHYVVGLNVTMHDVLSMTMVDGLE